MWCSFLFRYYFCFTWLFFLFRPTCIGFNPGALSSHTPCLRFSIGIQIRIKAIRAYLSICSLPVALSLPIFTCLAGAMTCRVLLIGFLTVNLDPLIAFLISVWMDFSSFAIFAGGNLIILTVWFYLFCFVLCLIFLMPFL